MSDGIYGAVGTIIFAIICFGMGYLEGYEVAITECHKEQVRKVEEKDGRLL